MRLSGVQGRIYDFKRRPCVPSNNTSARTLICKSTTKHEKDMCKPTLGSLNYYFFRDSLRGLYTGLTIVSVSTHDASICIRDSHNNMESCLSLNGLPSDKQRVRQPKHIHLVRLDPTKVRPNHLTASSKHQ